VRPIDGEREAGLDHHNGPRIGLVDILDQLVLLGLQVDGPAVDAFLAVAEGFALAPAGIAGRVVADDEDDAGNSVWYRESNCDAGVPPASFGEDGS
jgi:hypothetical protein